MKSFLLASSAAAVLALAAPAIAQVSLQDYARQLGAQGYTNVEISRDNGRVKLEAARGLDKREIVWDADTGAVLSDEYGRDDDDDSDGIGDDDDVEDAREDLRDDREDALEDRRDDREDAREDRRDDREDAREDRRDDREDAREDRRDDDDDDDDDR